MKVWEIKTHRHGIRLVEAADIRTALMNFDLWSEEELKRIGKARTDFYDDVISCVCLGEVVRP